VSLPLPRPGRAAPAPRFARFGPACTLLPVKPRSWLQLPPGLTPSAHFEAAQYFGLDPAQVTFFQQGFLPCMTEEGQVIMETPSKVGAGLKLGAGRKSGRVIACPDLGL
jgi:hypothetical protein